MNINELNFKSIKEALRNIKQWFFGKRCKCKK